MATFAKLDENNKVIFIEYIENAVLLDDAGVEQESKGLDFLRTIHKEPAGDWKQCSINTYANKHNSGDDSKCIRGNYPHIGWDYSPTDDVFYPVKPYDSWVWYADEWNWNSNPHSNTLEDLTNEELDAGTLYRWNDSSLQWEKKHIDDPIEYPPNT